MASDPNFNSQHVPFYTGRLVGLRSFAVNVTSGVLTGITYPGPWSDGDNEARCAMRDRTFYDDIPSMQPFNKFDESSDEEHSVGGLKCSCGYYAYFSGNPNDYQHGTNVEGIIEAWGRITMGTKGFRASKARIVGLVIPIDSYPTTAWEKLQHRLTCPAPSKGPHGWSYPYLAHEAGCSLPLFPYPTLMETIAAKYPSARLFNSMEEALRELPPTPVDVANQIVDHP